MLKYIHSGQLCTNLTKRLNSTLTFTYLSGGIVSLLCLVRIMTIIVSSFININRTIFIPWKCINNAIE